LAYELHRDSCGEDELVCRKCGERFSERVATKDGWHYQCPNEDCDGEGLTEDLVRLDDARIRQ
jgi:hypothetical protein